MGDVQLQLTTAPPRLGRSEPASKRLEHRTTLLAQWRRNWLERAACVAWASLDAPDDRAAIVCDGRDAEQHAGHSRT
jgi:hypothetical protein